MHWPKRTVVWTVAMIVVSQAARHFGGVPQIIFGWTVPWALIGLLGVAFLAGLIVQDFYNPDSWIWLNWRAWNRCFVMVSAVVERKFNPEMDLIRADIRTTRDLKGARIIVRAFSMNRAQRQFDEFVLSEATMDLPKGKQIQFDLAEIHLADEECNPKPRQWLGDAFVRDHIGSGRGILPENARNIVEIEIKCGFRKQINRIYIRVFSEPEVPRSAALVIHDKEEIFETS